MDPTSKSLLQRVQSSADDDSWRRLVELYRPLICGWLRRCHTQEQDADDLAQEVLALLVRELPKFSHSGRTGAFRAWLRSITANRLKTFWRAGRARPAAGAGDFQQMAEQLADSDSDLSRVWDREHDSHVLRRLLELLEAEFEPATLTAFRRTALDGDAPQQVAEELGLSVAAVYIARSRVLRRLREEAEGLID
jgi:RNA polymerase sigma-70 factor (ECF subfamily)